MRSNTALKVIIGIFAVIFIGHQLYSSLYTPITTAGAEYYEAVDGLKIVGTIIREETVITNNSSGVLHFVTNDGSRVAKNGTLAEIYDSEGASITVSRIAEVTSQIQNIEELQAYNDLQAADLELVSGKVSNALNGLITDSVSGDFSFMPEKSALLLSAINRRQMITGETTDFSAQLNSLNAELATLNASLPTAKGRITAGLSGYFVSGTDGFEKVLTCDDLTKITPEFLNNLKPQDLPDNTIGKIVSDYEWYIAAKVSINDSLKYKEGDTLTIKTSLKSNPELSVTVKCVNMSPDTDSAVLIFACRQMSSELAGMRTGAMTVISNVYKGLRLTKKCLRVVDGKTGVYVRSGITAKFVTVNVIYSNDDYIICEQTQSSEDVLRLYDEVIVKGKNLYDGKIIS